MNKQVAAEPGLSFEMVLEAVQESSRGRWFLEEFKSRSLREDTGRILDAIARLEHRVGTMSGGSEAASDLEKVRRAIADTRQHILKSQGASGLSQEGKLFAHLAELARTALAGDTKDASNKTLPEGIVLALRLVDSIDTTLNSKAASPDTFFHRDKDIFETPPATPKPVLATVSPLPSPAKPQAPVKVEAPVKPQAEAPPLGAKLVINRGKREETAPASAQIPPAAGEPAEATATASELPADGDQQGHPRIVIIRRKPEDMPEPAVSEEPKAEDAA